MTNIASPPETTRNRPNEDPVIPAAPTARPLSLGRNRGWLMRRALAGADILGLTTAFVVAALLARTPVSAVPGEAAIFLLTMPLWILLARLYDLYDHDETQIDHSTIDDLAPVLQMITFGTWLSTIGLFAAGELIQGRVVRIIWFWLFAIACVLAARVVARGLARRRGAFVQNTIIVGAGDVGQALADKLLHHPEYGINVVGFVDSNPKLDTAMLAPLSLLGGREHIANLIELLGVERVIIAFSNDDHEDTATLIRELRSLNNIHIDIVPRLFDLTGPNAELHSAGGLPLLGLASPQLSRSSRVIKRALDLVVSMVVLTLFSPLLVVIAFWIKLDSRGPVFFRQERIGYGGKPFRVLKFRTMIKDADARKQEFAHLNKHLGPDGDPRMFKIANDPRVTRAGRTLRRYFLDELPQLINVLKGEMSLIGPRPLIVDEARHIDGWVWRRLDLKPGMTGLWQVLGRSDLPFAEMVKLDYLYVTTWSLSHDVRLLLQTVPLVLRGESPV